MRRTTLAASLIGVAALLSSTTVAFAATEITWWHAMGAELGKKLEEIVAGYNASQTEYHVTPVFKGTYPETMTAAIAAFRAGEQQNNEQV
jgi:sn-glycerol 3-phosphate transport system substrate-binding protein